MCFTTKLLLFSSHHFVELYAFSFCLNLCLFIALVIITFFGPVLIDYYLYEKLNFNLEEEGQLCRKIS